MLTLPTALLSSGARRQQACGCQQQRLSPKREELMLALQALSQILAAFASASNCQLTSNPLFGNGATAQGLGPFLGAPEGGQVQGMPPAAGGSQSQGQGAAAVDWAESQLGVSEAANPDVVRGYSGGADQAWCADFVSTALEQSGGSAFGHQSSVQGILDWGLSNGAFISNEQASANPGCLREGDVAVWKEDGRSHVGLVTGVNGDGTFSTIEGNTSDQVARRQHSFSEAGLTGFVRAAQN